MSFSWASILSGGLMGLGSYLSQRETNRTNRDIADQATATNVAEAQRNRDFEERMSNTQYQRATADLKQSGLNPLLALPNGAGTPSGSTAQAETATMGNEIEGAIASAMQMKNLELAMEKQGEEISNLRAARAESESRTQVNKIDAQVKRKDIPKADLVNDVYDIIRPAVKTIKEKLKTNSNTNHIRGGLR